MNETWSQKNGVWEYIPRKVQKLVIPVSVGQDYVGVLSGQQEHVPAWNPGVHTVPKR